MATPAVSPPRSVRQRSRHGRKLEQGAGEGGVPGVAAPPLTACPGRRDRRGRNGHHGRPGLPRRREPSRNPRAASAARSRPPPPAGAAAAEGRASRRRCGGERPSSAPSPPPYRRPGPSSTVERAAPGHHRRRPRACRPCREKESLLEPKACAERESAWQRDDRHETLCFFCVGKRVDPMTICFSQ